MYIKFGWCIVAFEKEYPDYNKTSLVRDNSISCLVKHTLLAGLYLPVMHNYQINREAQGRHAIAPTEKAKPSPSRIVEWMHSPGVTVAN